MPSAQRKLTGPDRQFIANECLRELHRVQSRNDMGRTVASLKLLIEDKGMQVDDADVRGVLEELRRAGHVFASRDGGPLGDAPPVWQLTRAGIAYCQRRGLTA